MHADWTFLPLWQVGKTANIQLHAEIELASPFIEFLLDALALLLMLLPVFVLAVLVAIPNALAIPTLLEGITFLAARRTQLLGWGLVFRGGIAILLRIPERHGAELFSSLRCIVLFR